MMTHTLALRASLLGLCLCAAALTASADAPALARQLLRTAGISRGVCSVPRCGDGALALAIAQAATGMIVHATDASAANVAALRATAAANGTLGRSVFIEQTVTDALVYADNSIDLLVLNGLTDADLADVSGAEMARVLAPWRGCALAGQPAPVSGLTYAALSNWCLQFTIYNYQ